ncbi:MAG: TRAP-type transport system periplasmic protein [Clostridiales bacterium]|nr:TRAP-type transport system periplasmic protein [Clostridiales bacterium]
MKNTLKKVVALMIVTALAFTMVACSGSKEAPAPAKDNTQDQAQKQDTKQDVKQDTKKADPIKVAISHTSSTESPWEKASLKFAEIVNKESNGKFKVETFPNGTLCQKNWKVMIEMTQSGSSQIGIESITALASEVPELGTVQLPFLFNDDAHLIKFLENESPILQKWYKKFEEKNMVVIGVAPRKFRQLINNKRLIKTPEDIKGLKFRVPNNPFFVRVFELLGAKPVPLPSGEIYSAIQLGTVVGEDNSVPVVYDFKTHEVAKNMTIWNYMADASLVVINKDLWDSLSDEDKALFKKAAKEWVAVNINEDESYQVEARKNMEKAGVKFYDMSTEEKEPFKKLMEPLYEEVKQKIGEEDWNAFMKAVEEAK